jgi:hypothetical protein
MSEANKPRASGILPWPMLIVTVLVMVGATGVGLLLIPQLSLNAAIRGAMTAISVFLFMQLGLRLYVRSKQRGERP